MYVPQRGPGGSSLPGALSIAAAIERSDCVLAVITAKVDSAVQDELKFAFQKQKVVIPIVQSDFASNPSLAQFPRVFTFSAADDPGKLETQVVEFLKQQNLSKEKQQAIGGLVALGLGLLLLFSLSEK